MEELLKYFPDMKTFIDATEQEIHRPKNKRRRKNYYSGRKKRHTVKTQVMVNKKGIILHKTKHVNGKKHDYVDKAYKGVENDFPSMKAKLPVKKKKGKELSKKERRYNKKLNKERVVVEHSIRRIKTFNIMGDEFRNMQNIY